MELTGVTFLIALVLGAAAIALVFLTRRRCSRCRMIFHAIPFLKKRDLCPKCRAEIGQTSRLRMIAAIVFLCIILLSPVQIGDWHGRFWQITPYIVAFLLVVSKNCRRLALARMRFYLREIETLDFRAARRASGAKGTVTRRNGITIWTDAPSSALANLERGIQRGQDGVLRVTGRPGNARRPVRVLCFEREAVFQAYSQTMMTNHIGEVGGYYWGLLRKRIVLPTDAAGIFPNSLDHIAAHEMAHHLLWRTARRGAWIQEGLAVLAARGDAPPVEPFARKRFLRAADQRSELLNFRQLSSMRHAAVLASLRDPLNTRAIGAVMAFYAQSADFLEFLRRDNEAAFPQFILSRRPRGRGERHFAHCFGRAPDEAMARWIEQLRSAKIPAHLDAPAAARARIDAELIPAIVAADAPPAKRLQAIRHLAAAGYTWRLDILIGLLENAPDPLRAEAQRGLENVSGKAGRKHPAEWRAWWESVAESFAQAADGK